jgi:hypothetical protein
VLDEAGFDRFEAARARFDARIDSAVSRAFEADPYQPGPNALSANPIHFFQEAWADTKALIQTLPKAAEYASKGMINGMLDKIPGQGGRLGEFRREFAQEEIAEHGLKSIDYGDF